MIDASKLSTFADTIIVLCFFALSFSCFFYIIIDAVLDFIDSRKLKKEAKEARKAEEAEAAKTREE